MDVIKPASVHSAKVYGVQMTFPNHSANLCSNDHHQCQTLVAPMTNYVLLTPSFGEPSAKVFEL